MSELVLANSAVRAFSEDGSDASITVSTSSSIPAVVTFVSLSVYGQSLRLQFNAADTPTSITIERSNSAEGPWTDLASLPGSATIYTDQSVQVDITYYYRIRSVNASTTSHSIIRSERVSLPTLVLSPATNNTDGSIRLSGASSNPAFTTELQRSENLTGPWRNILITTGVPIVYNDWNIRVGITYYYRMVVIKDGQVKSESNTISSTAFAIAPLTPENFRGTFFASDSISLNWSDVTLEEGFLLERKRESEANWSLIATLEANIDHYTDLTVVEDGIYTYRLKSFNSIGSSPTTQTLPLKARYLHVIMEDDFDWYPSRGSWIYISSETTSLPGEGSNGTNSLWFNTATERLAQTTPLNVSGGGLIEFSMCAGASDGSSTLKRDKSEPGDEVVLEYSTNRQTWTPIQTIDTVYPALSKWTSFSLPIPHEACTVHTSFRWRQKAHDGQDLDVWALDNVMIRGTFTDSHHITSWPAPLLVQKGTSINLSVGLTQWQPNFQWYKNSEAIPNATQANYSVPSAAAGHAGIYVCKMTTFGSEVETEPVMVGVFEKKNSDAVTYYNEGGTFDLGVKIYPASLESDLNFSWHKTAGENLNEIGLVSGENSPFLQISSANANAQSTYQCRVTYQGNHTLDIGPYQVELFRAPTIRPISKTQIAAGSNVSLSIATSPPSATISVTGLPKGLRFDSLTSQILGNTSILKTHTITVNATNAHGAATPVSFQLEVSPFPESLTGTYRGIVQGTDSPLQHGGQLAFQINKKGSVSGSITYRGKTYRFVTRVWAEVDGFSGAIEASFKNRSGSHYLLEVSISGNLHAVTLSEQTTANTVLLTTGNAVSNPWSTTFPAPHTGLINIALEPAILTPIYLKESPQGIGFVNLKLNTRGIITLKGRLADGQTVTGSTIMGLGGHMPIFVNLYKGTGALTSITSYENGQANGTAYWSKSDQGEKSKDRSYKNGFARHPLTVTGEIYTPPEISTPLLPSLVATRAPVELVISTDIYPIYQRLVFSGAHKAVFPLQQDQNPLGFTLKVNTSTGIFTGNFKLSERHPTKPTQSLQNKISFQGCLFPGKDQGLGYFLQSESLTPEVPKNPPIWSGRVELNPAIDY